MSGGRTPLLQYAALPWRRGESVEILLVTSLTTRRWVIPKGWPIQGLDPPASAAQEAFEEAGIKGSVDAAAFGHFHYVKRRKGRTARMCRVVVFPLEVEIELTDWPERAERLRRWFAPDAAAAVVDEEELKRLVQAFAKSWLSSGRLP